MFKLTDEWLKKYYGSKSNQVNLAKSWLAQHSVEFKGDADVWKFYKHLVEYQPNTKNIVDQALANIGKEFDSELKCHRWINLMRVPSAIAYLVACEAVKPSTILELGVGGDSAISTSIFLSYLEDRYNPSLLSVDYHPLDMTWERYKDHSFWAFIQIDSIEMLRGLCYEDKRFDMIFIDTIHTYEHTKKEIELASQLTDNMLLDDVLFEGGNGGVKRAKEEWCEEHSDTWQEQGWSESLIGKRVGVENVALLQRKQIQPKSKIIRRRNV